MKSIEYPDPALWADLCMRPAIDNSSLEPTVRDIMGKVKINGDTALKQLTSELDGVLLDDLLVGQEEFDRAAALVDDDLKSAIELAAANIKKFHTSQQTSTEKVQTSQGVYCWRKAVAIDKVGLYIPGGSAPLFSTVLMLAIPASLAGCQEIVLCSPPDKEGKLNPAILYAASATGVTKVAKVGGAQAIAAMAYGTESIPAVYKILGPGNQYVTKAKELVQIDGVAIDMPAGPSELLVVADDKANPAFVAADLLSQAEHGADSQVFLVSNSTGLIEAVRSEIEQQLKTLERREIAQRALQSSYTVLVNSLEDACAFSNVYAPEHLILAVEDYATIAECITNAGSVFLGNYSCESAGDYASGTNHTLPTNGYAKAYSGVSLNTFMKTITFQEVTRKGLQTIGPAIETMAQAEGLQAHKNAVTIRLRS